MQLQQERQRHTNGTFRLCKGTANRGIDIPDYEPGDENNCSSILISPYSPLKPPLPKTQKRIERDRKLTTAPSTQFKHLLPNDLILHPTSNYRTGLNSNKSNHDAEEYGMHYYFIGDAVPGDEEVMNAVREIPERTGCVEGLVEGEDAVEDGGCCYEHGEVVAWVGMLVGYLPEGKF